MVTVGHWVLEESCRQLAVRRSAAGATLPLSVNLRVTAHAPRHGASELLELLNRYRITVRILRSLKAAVSTIRTLPPPGSTVT